jgi:hypothetical protein
MENNYRWFNQLLLLGLSFQTGNLKNELSEAFKASSLLK